MQFELTDSLIDDIISAMENQDVEYAVDAEEGQLVISDSDGHIPDDERYYILPEWGPSDGFELREDFVNNLHSPLAREELQSAMHSGRGVFKNFRNVLKSYPEIDKRWHIFKHRYMSARINEWYNSLREIWGLEKLDQLPELDDTLVHDDFSFKEYDSEADKKTILLNITADSCEDETLPLEVNRAFYELSRGLQKDFECAGRWKACETPALFEEEKECRGYSQSHCMSFLSDRISACHRAF